MQILSPPPMAPVIVHWVLPETPFYEAWDFWVSIGTMLLALFTLYLVLETRRMRLGSDKAMGDMVKHAEAAANAAERTATATRSLVEVGNRAWLVMERPEVSEVQSGDYASFTITIRATLRNSGLTPAFDVRALGQFGQWALPLEQWPLGEPPVPSVIVGPNIVFDLPVPPLPVTNEDLEEVRAGRRALLFFADCVYKDVFGEPHRTRWCLQCSLDRRTLQSFNSEFQMMT